MSLVKVLRKNYGDFHLSIKDWTLPDQGIFALTGPSGSGKSSVVRCLLGLDEPEEMSWQWGSEDLARLSVGDRRLGVVFQGYLLFPHMTARQNIEFAAQARGVSPADVTARLKSWESSLALGGFMDRPAQQLSGGEQQRVALARALIGRPRFLFLDEPFSALDAQLRQESRSLVNRMVREEKIPCLLITHDPEDVRLLADREFFIEKGSLKESSG